MKKIITAISLIAMANVAEARAIPSLINQNNKFEYAYNRGYRAGKQHVYNQIGKDLVYVGTAVIAGIIIYQLGKNSNWTVSERGVGYRF